MIKNKLFAILALLLPLASCTPSNNEEYTPVGSLENVFSTMKNNNFTLDITTSYSIHNKNKINTKSYYTPYSIENEGDNGFYAIAQKDDYIFRYSFLDNEIVTGTPILDYVSGLRYASLYDYKKGIDKFDISVLPDKPGEDGYYVYPWGENKQNDGIFMELFLQISSFSLPPDETKIKVIGNTLEIKTIVLDYTGERDYASSDTVDTYVYDINETENTAIREYLANGGEAKSPLDNKFFRTINPYLTNENYKVVLDATKVKDEYGNYYDSYLERYMTKDASLYVSNGTQSGYFMQYGVANSYSINEEGRLEVLGTPMADSDGSFFYNFLGEIEPYYFGQLDYSLFLGYKSEENENVYILSDSYLLQILSGICLIELYDEMYADYAIFEIIDEEKHEFNLYFNLYNRITNQDLGQFKASFSNFGTTSIPAVDNYRFKGQDPRNQNKQDLIDTLELFKEGNYSLDYITSVGITKYYYTENYMFALPYSNKNANYGFIKYNNGIYYFNYDFETNEVILNTEVNYSGMKLPGVGSYYFANDDLGYLSHLSDEIYDYDNYVIDYQNGEYYWKNSSVTFSKTCFDYFQTYSNILPTGTGFVVNKASDPRDTKVTIISNFITNDGMYTGSYQYTFYDIGATSFLPLDNFLN